MKRLFVAGVVASGVAATLAGCLRASRYDERQDTAIRDLRAGIAVLTSEQRILEGKSQTMRYGLNARAFVALDEKQSRRLQKLLGNVYQWKQEGRIDADEFEQLVEAEFSELGIAFDELEGNVDLNTERETRLHTAETTLETQGTRLEDLYSDWDGFRQLLATQGDQQTKLYAFLERVVGYLETKADDFDIPLPKVVFPDFRGRRIFLLVERYSPTGDLEDEVTYALVNRPPLCMTPSDFEQCIEDGYFTMPQAQEVALRAATHLPTTTNGAEARALLGRHAVEVKVHDVYAAIGDRRLGLYDGKGNKENVPAEKNPLSFFVKEVLSGKEGRFYLTATGQPRP